MYILLLINYKKKNLLLMMAARCCLVDIITFYGFPPAMSFALNYCCGFFCPDRDHFLSGAPSFLPSVLSDDFHFSISISLIRRFDKIISVEMIFVHLDHSSHGWTDNEIGAWSTQGRNSQFYRRYSSGQDTNKCLEVIKLLISLLN